MNKKLCIIVPYRDREAHLNQFLPHMTGVLKQQNIDYHIAVIEQEVGKHFNRAKLLNVGIDQFPDFDYYCFHDVDMLAINSDYSYCPNPTHLAAQAEQFGYKLPYNEYFGGVTILNRESVLKINGLSNEYKIYGGEDDSLFRRCVAMKLPISRKQCSYRSLSHEKFNDFGSPEYQAILDRLRRFNELEFDGTKIIEGLSTLEYSIVVDKENIYENTTKIIVSV